MLAIDLVRFCAEMLKRLSECDILLDDYKRGYLVRMIIKAIAR